MSTLRWELVQLVEPKEPVSATDAWWATNFLLAYTSGEAGIEASKRMHRRAKAIWDLLDKEESK